MLDQSVELALDIASHTNSSASQVLDVSAFGDEPPTIANRRFNKTAVALESDFSLNLRYPGQYFDRESGLHYNYFRTYDPATERYTQADPIGLKGGWNRFGYVRGNALRSTDSTGLADDTLVMSIAVPSLTTACLTNPVACGVGLAGGRWICSGDFALSTYPRAAVKGCRLVDDQLGEFAILAGSKAIQR